MGVENSVRSRKVGQTSLFDGGGALSTVSVEAETTSRGGQDLRSTASVLVDDTTTEVATLTRDSDKAGLSPPPAAAAGVQGWDAPAAASGGGKRGESEGSYLKRRCPRWCFSSALWFVLSVFVLVGPMVTLLGTGRIDCVPDQVFVLFVLAIDMLMIYAVYLQRARKRRQQETEIRISSLAHARERERKRTEETREQPKAEEPTPTSGRPSTTSQMTFGKVSPSGSSEGRRSDTAREGQAVPPGGQHWSESYLVCCHFLLFLVEIPYCAVFARSKILIGIAFVALVGLIVQWLLRTYVLKAKPCIMDDFDAGIPDWIRSRITTSSFDLLVWVFTFAMLAVAACRLVDVLTAV